MNSFNDPGNYTNPVTYFPVNEAVTLDIGSASRLTFSLKKSLVETDIGWILENTLKEEVVTVEDPSKELYIHFVQKLQLKVQVPQRRTKITRNYLKIQELLAKIGGVFNALTIIFQVLLYDYIKFKYKIHYSQFALTEEDFMDDENETNQKNIKVGGSPQKVKLDEGKGNFISQNKDQELKMDNKPEIEDRHSHKNTLKNKAQYQNSLSNSEIPIFQSAKPNLLNNPNLLKKHPLSKSFNKNKEAKEIEEVSSSENNNLNNNVLLPQQNQDSVEKNQDEHKRKSPDPEEGVSQRKPNNQ
eukprot:CAMPEP_0170525642 /NCGR_PEP_ID=MMETSP0209-20121228/11096_1 /TAXON_ID=665100 ORGANISM="Litonotus pictus, Strain P1" /NCGR_SAMPLE_ID=MMETSP0209 /ASSEMBLY_ACC=CAM_ASM_000301 /LENGTH=298 /DNA_ID=CAMNT_0010815001 /DNA_START=57 /DNA_END=952 /DNA_ORIENTATION=-